MTLISVVEIQEACLVCVSKPLMASRLLNILHFVMSALFAMLLLVELVPSLSSHSPHICTQGNLKFDALKTLDCAFMYCGFGPSFS